MNNTTDTTENVLDDNQNDAPLDNDGNETTENDISDEELALLDSVDEDGDGSDDEALRQAELDNTDDDGGPLNEEGSADDQSGDDLDVPGAGADDEDEEIGEEDEENNDYSGAEEQNE